MHLLQAVGHEIKDHQHERRELLRKEEKMKLKLRR
jgi:hypothetical protein